MEEKQVIRPQVERSKTLERQESIAFVNLIKTNIVDTFPFLTDIERVNFTDKIDSLLKDNEVLSDSNKLVMHLRSIIASLNNTHTLLKRKNIKERYKLQEPIFYLAGKFWVDIDGSVSEVLTLNGSKICNLVNEKRKEMGGGTEDYQIYSVLDSIQVSEKESDVILEIMNSEGEKSLVQTKFVNIIEKPEKDIKYVEGKILPDNIGYLNVRSWSNTIKISGKNIAELVEEELNKLQICTSLIIDIRENGGGDSSLAHQVAGHFIDKRRQFSKILIKVNDQNKLDEHNLFVVPSGEFLDKKVVILTSPKCLSSSDMFVLMLKDTGRAKTIGQTTGGGSGNAKSFKLHLEDEDFVLRVSTWRMMRNDGRQLENIGIEADIPVDITPSDVIQHRDVVLEKAVEYLKSR